MLRKLANNLKPIFGPGLLWPLKKVSFAIEEGETVGFLGANGAGKTTMLKIMMGLIRPNEGEVTFSPKLGKGRKEIFSNIGFMPERPYFYPYLTGEEFLNYMGKLQSLPPRVREKKNCHSGEKTENRSRSKAKN